MKRRHIWWAAIALLLIPAAAMLLTDEVSWGAEDFIAAASLIGGAWLALELARRFLIDRRARLAAAVIIGLVVLAVWAHLAVGIWN